MFGEIFYSIQGTNASNYSKSDWFKNDIVKCDIKCDFQQKKLHTVHCVTEFKC